MVNGFATKNIGNNRYYGKPRLLFLMCIKHRHIKLTSLIRCNFGYAKKASLHVQRIFLLNDVIEVFCMLAVVQKIW